MSNKPALFLTIWMMLLIGVSLSACAPSRHVVRKPSSEWSQQAYKLAQAGQYRQAAQAYQRAAELAPATEQSRYLLQAAKMWLQAGQTGLARQALDRIDSRPLSPLDRITFHLIQAQLALEQGEPAQALNDLDQVQPDEVPSSLQFNYHQLRARAFALQGDLIASIQERVLLEPRLHTPQETEDNNQAILEALMLLPRADLDRWHAPPHSNLAGWIALARIFRSHPYRSEELDQALTGWQQAFPYHPAHRGRFLQRYLTSRLKSYRPPDHIALLLPASGPYQTAGEAIYKGIQTLRNQPGFPYQPRWTRFDSAGTDPIAIYRQTHELGIDILLGPLQKPTLEQLARLQQFNPPVLALNTIEGLTRPGLYQFALTPEEAVEQTASSAWLHNHQKGLAMVPDSSFGTRIEQHFQKYWNRLGGQILEIQSYDPTATDFSAPLQALLNIDESRLRFHQLRKVVWEIKFEPRIRHDADFLFLQAQPRQGRLIRPQLLFHKAGYLPVYATRDIYEGHPNPQWDKDLEGIRFCDIPWLLNGEYASAPSVAHFEAEQERHAGADLRLVALGMDAYQIPFTLLAGAQRVAGVTGTLTLGPDGRIHRQMTCAEFHEGRPEIFGLAPEITPDVSP